MSFKDPFLIREQSFHLHKTHAEIMRILRSEKYKENIDKSEFGHIINGEQTGPKAERIIKETRQILQGWQHGKGDEAHAQ